MTLTEYKNQENPVRMPVVELESHEYKRGASITVKRTGEITQIFINGYDYDYVQVNNEPRLYTTDDHGNPKKLTCFYIKPTLQATTKTPPQQAMRTITENHKIIITYDDGHQRQTTWVEFIEWMHGKEQLTGEEIALIAAHLAHEDTPVKRGAITYELEPVCLLVSIDHKIGERELQLHTKLEVHGATTQREWMAIVDRHVKYLWTKEDGEELEMMGQYYFDGEVLWKHGYTKKISKATYDEISGIIY